MDLSRGWLSNVLTLSLDGQRQVRIEGGSAKEEGRGFDSHALSARVEPPIPGQPSMGVYSLLAVDTPSRYTLLNTLVKVYDAALDILNRLTLITLVKVGIFI